MTEKFDHTCENCIHVTSSDIRICQVTENFNSTYEMHMHVTSD